MIRVANDPARARSDLLTRIADLTTAEYAARVEPTLVYVTRAEWERQTRS